MFVCTGLALLVQVYVLAVGGSFEHPAHVSSALVLRYPFVVSLVKLPSLVLLSSFTVYFLAIFCWGLRPRLSLREGKARDHMEAI